MIFFRFVLLREVSHRDDEKEEKVRAGTMILLLRVAVTVN
jgi:hypothetical protein